MGAEEDLFYPDKNESAKSPGWNNNVHPEILFYGSFIPLQGPQFIADAVRQYQGPPVKWVFLGDGPLLEKCQKITAGLPNVSFENWLPYLQLPSRIRRADILQGISFIACSAVKMLILGYDITPKHIRLGKTTSVPI